MKCKRCGWKTCACDMRIKTDDEIARMETPQTGGNRMTTTIEEIRKRLNYLHTRLTYDSGAPPATFAVLSDAIDELAALRAQVETLTAERDEARMMRDEWATKFDEQFERAEAEREACAKVCEANANRFSDNGDEGDLHFAHMADARDIRARGKL